MGNQNYRKPVLILPLGILCPFLKFFPSLPFLLILPSLRLHYSVPFFYEDDLIVSINE
jgi:hypothetical protein